MALGRKSLSPVAGDRLPAWAGFAALIAAAGLPIYIHAPKFYVDSYGVSLATMGVVLFGLRLLDVVQDPVLGWLAERGRDHRRAMVAMAVAVMAGAMVMLFALPPLGPALLWFALSLALLFSAFSFLTIAFYAEGLAKGARLGPTGHLRLAGWRESGALLGVTVAAVAPVALAGMTDRPFAAFAAGFCALALVVAWAMGREWRGAAAPMPATPLRQVLADRDTRRLLILALVNSAPVAVTSTLFLFFVESRLAAPGSEGPLLVLFFLAAAVSAPVWSRLAAAFGLRRVLLVAMVLAVVSFAFAATLGAGDLWAFALICLVSGAAVGADMTLLPALFSRHLARSEGAAGEAVAFGLWSFMTKLSLALAAGLLLPALQAQGFTPGTENTPQALSALTLAYAVLPCGLKLLAIGLLATMPLPGE
ncbi:sugar:cation symporter [Aliigemmobacter aestuarii]|uniref:Sugar:cation symporter n=1 Tax=Aliigemmobacter aestuarii TaxID=1445661 RepID=A0A4V3V0E4_9RHOB|nr:MFS transporter [Gemmobacter aestuarii]THD83642.1 sugar:cation symporter [Gemmobacter aestuarii]